jgi:ribonuclease BN (tRNA processing enzyme)
MRLTVVGCSGSVPSADSPASCYLVQAHDGERRWNVLLDLGSGALGPLHRHVDPADVDAVLLSHLHADHCLDLCGLYVVLKYAPRDGTSAAGHRRKPQVWGPTGTAGRACADSWTSSSGASGNRSGWGRSSSPPSG